MASTMSSAKHSPQSGYGDGSDGGGAAAGGQDKSPLGSMNLNFLKTLTDKRTTREGNPPKRRGPKPDSKPALTRRQELNRQAQRTHRERKELYIKALEDEVLRLKEIYSNICKDKEKLADENRQLKTLLSQNGLAMSADDAMSNPSLGAFSSSGSVSGSYAAASSHTSAFTPPPPPSGSGHHQQIRGLSPQFQGQQQQQHGHHHHPSGQSGQSSSSNVDYEQAGIDFVLTYDDPSKAYLSPPPAEPEY